MSSRRRAAPEPADVQEHQSSWSIKNPIPIILLFVLLTVAGIAGFMKMRINNNPDIDFPLVTVTAVQPGAAPVGDGTPGHAPDRGRDGRPQRRAPASPPTIGDGVSSTIIEFELGTDLEKRHQRRAQRREPLRVGLPGDMQEPVVQRIDITGDALVTYVVRSPTMTPEQISWFVDNTVGQDAAGHPGRRRGQSRRRREPRDRVELDPDRLAA